MSDSSQVSLAGECCARRCWGTRIFETFLQGVVISRQGPAALMDGRAGAVLTVACCAVPSAPNRNCFLLVGGYLLPTSDE